MCAGSFIRYALCLWLASTMACFEAEPLTEGSLSGTVYLSQPVAGATVRLHFLDEQGEIISSTVPFTTGSDGRFTFDLGTRYGRVLVVATGGGAPDIATGETVPVDTELVAVLPRYHPAYPYEAMVTPLTTLATALGEARFQRNDKEETHSDAIKAGYELLSMHVGGFDLVHTVPHDAGERVVAQDQGRVYHGLVLAALSSLAARIARESNISTRSLHTGHLLDVLIEDVTGPDALFNGEGAAGPLRIGSCPPPIDCPPGETCPTVCDLDENTLRADLATALAFDFIPSVQNRTGWTFDDAQPLADLMRTNPERELFGPDAESTIEELGGALPLMRMVPSTMDDESQDLIEFSSDAVPIHTATAAVALGAGTSCPTVYKHTSRLDDPDDNPVRWVFEVLDQRGAAIRPDGGAYRVRRRGGDWLTDWLPAMPLASVGDGVRFEVVLLRSEVPALGTEQGIFDIEFRGQDMLGARVTMTRCWEHVPLAAPVDIGPAREATGPESLHAWGLEQGKALAPLLNGVPLDQGAGIMEFEIRNGTDEAVYITLGYDQPVATYTKDWIETSGLVRSGDEIPYPCWNTGECALEFPSGLGTYDPPDTQGSIPDLIGGLRVWDMNSTPAHEIQPCVQCDVSQYVLQPRTDPVQPRVYRVMLVTTSLQEIGPYSDGDSPSIYADVSLHDLYAPESKITGARYPGDDVNLCVARDQYYTQCTLLDHYVRYRALTDSTITAGAIQVTVRTSPTLDRPARLLDSGRVQLSSYFWETVEQPDLPAPYPLP